MKKIINHRILILFLLTLAVEAVAIWWVAQSTDNRMRTALLKQATIAAHAINIKHITSLTATNKDLNTLAYKRIKRQLALMRQADNQCRFLYLIGQRPDGVIFFFLDSLPVNSEDYAPPGLIYEEVSDSYRRVFTTKKGAVVGPITDRWGTLITALIPIQDPDTDNLITVLGMDIDASDWNRIIFWRCAFPAVIILLIGFLILLLISRHLAMKAQLENKEKLRNIIENSTNLFYSHTPDHILTYLSPQIKDILGYTVEEAMIKWTELASDNPNNEEGIKKTVAAIETGQRQAPYDLELLHKNGKKVILDIREAPVVKNGKTMGIVGAATDITKRKQAEKAKTQLETQLKQSQKMESIGMLTGGIAHDFNNILGIIIGNTELALDDIPKWNSAHTSLEEIKKASFRAKNIVKQLLSFSRKTDQQLQPIQIALVIKEALKFLRSTIPTTINIHQDIQTTEETILADPTQINQIIMNLCINASHAMELTGGDMTVTVEKVMLDDNSAKDYPDLKSGYHVKIMVSDTGLGIDFEIINQIFDPYFTTKEVGKGSGMGLAVVHGIVKNHNGAIAVESSLGKGTKFSILFPLATEKPIAETKVNKDIPGGNETILFVDDEISITQMVKRMFERLGYKVETATTPQDALELFRSKFDHFDLVITDMTMPQMTGVKLSEKLMDIRKDIPIIICTGHSTIVDEGRAKDLGLAAYIMKPIDMQETAQTIRKILDEK